jgi:hypothetical protein
MKRGTLLLLLCIPSILFSGDLLDELREAQDARLQAPQGWFTAENLARVNAGDFVTDNGAAPAAQVLFQHPAELAVLDHIVEAIKGAQSEILINTYLLTYEPIISALIHAKYVNRISIVIILEPIPAARDYRVPQILISNSVYTFFCMAKGYNYNNYIILDRSIVFSGFPFTQTFDKHSFTGTIFRGRAVAPFTTHFLQHLHKSANPEIQRVHRSNEDIPSDVQTLLLDYALPDTL